MTRSRNTKSKHPIASYSPGRFAGTARVTDVFTVAIGTDKGWPHPAKMPVRLAEMLIRTFAPRGGTVLDPFSGSGTTVLAAFGTGRSGIGIECDKSFHNMSLHRLREARKAAT